MDKEWIFREHLWSVLATQYQNLLTFWILPLLTSLVVGTAYLLLEKLKCQLFAFLLSPLFGSLAAGEQTHNLDFRDKCLTATGEAHPWDHSLLGQWLQKVCVTETAACCASETTPRSHLCSWVLSSVRDSVLSVCGVIFESLFLYVAPYLALQPFWGFFELPTTIFFPLFFSFHFSSPVVGFCSLPIGKSDYSMME